MFRGESIKVLRKMSTPCLLQMDAKATVEERTGLLLGNESGRDLLHDHGGGGKRESGLGSWVLGTWRPPDYPVYS